MTSRKALNNLRQCNACFGVGAAFRDELDAIEKDLDQLDQLKAVIKILKYNIGFDFLEDSNGVKAIEVLNGASLLKSEQYELLKEVLNE